MKTPWIYILLLLLLSVGYIKWQNDKQIQLQKLIDINEEEYKYLKLQNQLLQDYYILQYTYNGNTMNDCIVYDEFGKSINLSELLSSDYKVLFYISQNHCTSCVKRIVEDLKLFMDNVSFNKILIVGEFENKRKFHSFMKGYDLDCPMFLVYEQTNPNKILKDENLPYVCLINNEMLIKDLFIPIKELPNYNIKYYDTIIHKYKLNL